MYIYIQYIYYNRHQNNCAFSLWKMKLGISLSKVQIKRTDSLYPRMLSRVLLIDSTCAGDTYRGHRRPGASGYSVGLWGPGIAPPGGRRRSFDSGESRKRERERRDETRCRRASRRCSVAPRTKGPGAAARQCRARDRGERTRVSCVPCVERARGVIHGPPCERVSERASDRAIDPRGIVRRGNCKCARKVSLVPPRPSYTLRTAASGKTAPGFAKGGRRRILKRDRGESRALEASFSRHGTSVLPPPLVTPVSPSTMKSRVLTFLSCIPLEAPFYPAPR